ncbi:hypothetical protein C8E95_6882 [Pseudonocardia autotrophica]|nr:hypothetical protein C8E95_6882 [Pseudonocardia autotrophica]
MDAAELLARSDAPPVTTTGSATTGRRGRPRPALAIEDIPLSDVPLMEATLDRAPEPPPALPRRERRERPVTTDQPERATDRSERATERRDE